MHCITRQELQKKTYFIKLDMLTYGFPFRETPNTGTRTAITLHTLELKLLLDYSNLQVEVDYYYY